MENATQSLESGMSWR